MYTGTYITNTQSDSRHLLLARVADEFIMQGAFTDLVSDETAANVEEFCSRILFIYQLPSSRLFMAEKAFSVPFRYKLPAIPSGKLFDRSFLDKMGRDIANEAAEALEDEEDFEIIPASEVFGWRIAALTAVYSNCGSVLPAHAYAQTCKAVAVRRRLSKSYSFNSELYALLCPPDNQFTKHFVSDQLLSVKNSLKLRLIESGVHPVVADTYTDVYWEQRVATGT